MGATVQERRRIGRAAFAPGRKTQPTTAISRYSRVSSAKLGTPMVAGLQAANHCNSSIPS